MKSDYTSHVTPAESIRILGRLSEACASLGNGPLSSQCIEMVRAQNWSALLSFEFPYSSIPCNGGAIRDLIYARQIQAFYSKAKFLPLGLDLESEALVKFEDAERRCLITNLRMKYFSAGQYSLSSFSSIPQKGLAERNLSNLFRARDFIQYVLGKVPPIEMLQLEFGPGATTNVLGRQACPRAKLGAELLCSTNLLPHVGHLLAEMPGWTSVHKLSESDDSYVVSVRESRGKVQFVPKNAKSLRSIVVEPTVNTVLQKGLGTYLKERLLRVGLDLTDQRRNQSMACKGSLNNELATVDLSMASDTISRELVRFLLPEEWFAVLDVARTSSVELPDGRFLDLEKFSSMGNAFTFELESLIFWSLALACAIPSARLSDVNRRVRGDAVSVFGDDIVLPSASYPDLEPLLEVCGFVVNKSKSFVDGPFRESCGADFLYGYDVRPFFQKELVSNRTLFTMHNFFVRHSEFELARAVLDEIHPEVILWGPDGHGDGHLIGTYESIQNREMRRCQWEGVYFYTYVSRPSRLKTPNSGDAALPVYSVYIRSGEKGPTDPFIVRGTAGYEKRRIYTLYRGVFR